MVFSIVALCALTTVLCSRIKAKYKKNETFKADVDKEIGVKDLSESFSMKMIFSWGLKLFKIYMRSKPGANNSCCCPFERFSKSNRNNTAERQGQAITQGR